MALHESQMDLLKLSYTANESIKISHHLEELLGNFYDPTILLLGVYPRKMKTCAQKMTRMCTAASVVISKHQKQPKWPFTGKWLH